MHLHQDVYFDDESAEVVISSLRLGDDQETSSLFTNSNWFAFEDDKISNESSAEPVQTKESASDTQTETSGFNGSSDQVISTEDDKTVDTAIPREDIQIDEPSTDTDSGNSKETTPPCEPDKPSEWVEWRETLDTDDIANTDMAPEVSGRNLEMDSSTEISVSDSNIPESSQTVADSKIQKQLDNLLEDASQVSEEEAKPASCNKADAVKVEET
ncbi:hypothetical protein QQ045_010254 [Rhodiola kirilowii]